jgi:hypothetical protein
MNVKFQLILVIVGLNGCSLIAYIQRIVVFLNVAAKFYCFTLSNPPALNLSFLLHPLRTISLCIVMLKKKLVLANSFMND